MDAASAESLFDFVFAAFCSTVGVDGGNLTGDSLVADAVEGMEIEEASEPCIQESSTSASHQAQLESNAKVRFPSLDCRSMWHKWLQGDASTHGTPFVRFFEWDKCDPAVYCKTAQIMNILSQIALDAGLGPSMDELDAIGASPIGTACLDGIFDRAFEVFVVQFTVSTQSIITADKKCVTIRRLTSYVANSPIKISSR
ncbi:Aste57867_19742 [Aphanomyces stellatus]|uniref:Aste57867_19742 protein n=1 Tax=Aphanomyces stellatus TaxID=120398 RepID=A0A485LD99_9STRA|nr:hypothetical protein As57867_019677 [Aphanomyces stellatus]VFT96440.1 Aste57867_19742 [Aphanomyces stellatus]